MEADRSKRKREDDQRPCRRVRHEGEHETHKVTEHNEKGESTKKREDVAHGRNLRLSGAAIQPWLRNGGAPWALFTTKARSQGPAMPGLSDGALVRRSLGVGGHLRATRYGAQ